MTRPLIELPSVREGRLRAMLAEKELELTEKELEIAEKDLAIEGLKTEIDRLKNVE